MITCVLLFMAGLGASIGTVTSIVTNVKNFDDKVSTLLVAILITYMKMAQNFDEALKEGFFPEADDSIYLIIIGVLTTIVMIIGMFTMRKVELGQVLETISKETDPTGVLIFICVCGFYLFTYWVLVKLLGIYAAGVPVILFFLLLNFLMLGLSVFLVYKAAKSGKGVGLSSLSGALKKKEMRHLGDMIGELKYWCLLISTMMVVGAGYSYQENSVKLAAEAQAIGSIVMAESTFWLTDAIGRFGGGVAAYFLVEKVNGYIFAIIWAICSLIGNLCVFAIIGLDIDSGALIIILSFF